MPLAWLARRLVPARWRETVERDLRDEAARHGRRGVRADAWVAGHLVRIGTAFRWRRMPRARGFSWRVALDRLQSDTRHAWRGLRARAGASLGTVVVLTIGIGLTTIIFALTDPFLLRPLPYRDPEPLVILTIEVAPGLSALAAHAMNLGPDLPTLAEWQSRTDLFQDVAAYGILDQVRLATPQGAASLAVWTVSGNFLSMLGGQDRHFSAVQPAHLGAPRFLVVTNSTAQARLGLSPGASATLRAEWQRDRSDAAVTVVPAMGQGFLFPSRGSRPAAVSPAEFGPVVWRRGPGSIVMITGIARLQPGIAAGTVKAALDGRLTSSGLQLVVEPLKRHLTATMRPLALGALAAGLLIVLVCTANVMNLLVARGLYRARDFATCQALGASRFDLFRLVFLELVAIGGAAAVAGLTLAHVGLGAIAAVMPVEYGILGQPEITVRVVLFTIGLTGVMVLACAVPAWLSARSVSSASISRARRDEPRAVRRWRFLLAAGQTMVAMVLLAGAALLARSYANLWLQTTGFAPEARLVSVSYPAARTTSQFVTTVSTTIDALRRVPGISEAAAGTHVGSLLDGFGGGGGPTIRAGNLAGLIMPAQVSTQYFAVVGTSILAGRTIQATDRGWDAVVVNQAFTERAWPDTPVHEIIGRQITKNGQPGRVVGVVQDTYTRALDVAPGPRVYQPLEGTPTGPRRLSFAIRLATDGPVPETALRRAVASVDADAIVESVDSVYGRLADSVRDRTFAALILGLFATAGLGVTAAGIFAVVAFVAARRTREIAIRVALGARPGDVRRLVVRDAVLATFAGSVAGLAASRWLAKTIESQLYGVTTGDWVTPGVAVAGLVGVTAFAAWWPTRRALAVQPTVALRVE